jgi:hypothetical protein
VTLNWRRIRPGHYVTDGCRAVVKRFGRKWRWKLWYLTAWSALTYDTMAEAVRAAESQYPEPGDEEE